MLNALPLGRLKHQFWRNCYFKFVLPHVERIRLHDIELDLSQLPLTIRNRIINIGYEDAERELCKAMLTQADNVLELGGGLGFLGLFCQLKLGIRHYATVEANPTTFEILRTNYRLNNLEPIAWNLALGPADGAARFDIEGAFWQHHICENTKDNGVVLVESATLPAILARVEFPVTALLVDIEGGEAHIDFQTIPASVKKIIMEVHRESLSEQAVKRLFSRIREQGFHTEHCRDTTFGFVRN